MRLQHVIRDLQTATLDTEKKQKMESLIIGLTWNMQTVNIQLSDSFGLTLS